MSNIMTEINKLARCALLISVLCLSFLMVACDFDESKNNFQGGELLDGQVMESIKNSLASTDNTDTTAENTTEKSTEQETDKGTEADSDSALTTEQKTDMTAESEVYTDQTEDRVYWIKSGKVWHIDEHCRHIKHSNEILSGSVDEAKEAGKTKVCGTCGK